jgi:hypothetical protein
MDSRLRRVRNLRLRAPDEALNRRGAILIEDALRTASLPDANGSRLLLIRHLQLGRIRADSPPSMIALRLETVCRQLAESAIYGALPGAAQAPAVYFDDALEPYVALALRIAAGEDTSAWFWSVAVRGWSPGMPRDQALRAILAATLTSNTGPMAALTLLRTLLTRGRIAPLLTALTALDGEDLLRAFAWSRPPDSLPADFKLPHAFPTPALLSIAKPWILSWGRRDPRSLWLACAICAIERPAFLSQPSLPHKAAACVASICEGQESPAPEKSPAALIFHFDRDANISHRAGLFFLIPVMERLHMQQEMDQNPDLAWWSLPWLVLREIASRLATPLSDPAIAALGELPSDIPDSGRGAVQAWIRRIRQYTRRTAGIGLHSLVCRTGRISATPTHLDVVFRLDRVDMRVRRAGLDIDPGWTPWVSRVIRFHYVGDRAYDA